MKALASLVIGMSVLAVSCDRSAVTAVAEAAPPSAAADAPAPAAKDVKDTGDGIGRVEKTNAEWKKILTPQQYNILREKGTERSGTGKDLNNHQKGTFTCAACGLDLFASDTKFESGTGWPSFWQPIAGHVKEIADKSHGMTRTEVVCARCDGHLGHVFDDGPKPTGLRYCMNNVSMKFVPAPKGDEKKPGDTK
jgi:peptide-methionine (R)-S-oxide reductase